MQKTVILVPEWVKSPNELANVVNKVIVPDFLPKKDAKIVTDENATSLSSSSFDDAVVIDELREVKNVPEKVDCRLQDEPYSV